MQLNRNGEGEIHSKSRGSIFHTECVCGYIRSKVVYVLRQKCTLPSKRREREDVYRSRGLISTEIERYRRKRAYTLSYPSVYTGRDYEVIYRYLARNYFAFFFRSFFFIFFFFFFFCWLPLCFRMYYKE